MRSKYVLAISIAFVTFIVYLPSLQNGFITWDDGGYVKDNSFIRSFDIQLLRSAFLEFHLGNWHPIIWISHACDYAIWGLNPLGHHLANNIIHSLNTFLVVLLILRLLKASQEAAGPKGASQPLLSDRTMKIAAAATGLLFGLHPLHVESVAWVSERKDLLCAFFFLLTLITYTDYVRDLNTGADLNARSRYFNRKYITIIALFILALLSKPMAVTLPLVLLILDWYPFRKIQSLKTLFTSSVEKLPFFALMLISSIVTILAQNSAGAMGLGQAMPWGTQLLVAAKALIAYLVKMIAPFHLVPFYNLRHPANLVTIVLQYIIPSILVIAITAICIACVRKNKLWLSIWSYYVITLLPVLGIVQVGSQAMADRYTYLPSLGPFFIVGLLFAKLYEKVSALDQRRMTGRLAGATIAMAVLFFLSYATIKQIGIWRNSTVFWNYVIDKEPGFPNAYVNLGNEYTDGGLFDMAIEQYQKALSFNPDYDDAYNALGYAYFLKGQTDRAIEQFQTALRLKPDFAEAHFNLGNSYLRKGARNMAREEFELGLKIQPDNYIAREILNSIDSM